jgi:hypothetical protein
LFSIFFEIFSYNYFTLSIEKITAGEIIEKALEGLSKEELEKLTGKTIVSDYLVKSFLKELNVEHLKNTHLIEISIKSNQMTGLENIINLIMKEYIEETNKDKNIEDNQRIAYLEKEKSKIEASIIEKMEIVDKIAKEVGTGNFDSNDIPYKVELDNLEASYVEVYKNTIRIFKKILWRT